MKNILKEFILWIVIIIVFLCSGVLWGWTSDPGDPLYADAKGCDDPLSLFDDCVPICNGNPIYLRAVDQGGAQYGSLTDIDTRYGDPIYDSVDYSWYFGDGNYGSGVTTTHTYSTYGIYTVLLTVDDAAEGKLYFNDPPQYDTFVVYVVSLTGAQAWSNNIIAYTNDTLYMCESSGSITLHAQFIITDHPDRKEK